MKNRCEPEKADLVAQLGQINSDFRKVQKGYKASLYGILIRCYEAALALKIRPTQFKRLKNDPYWKKASRKLPSTKGKPDDVVPWAVFMSLRPVGKTERNRAGRWSKVLSHCLENEMSPEAVTRLLARGGVKGVLAGIKVLEDDRAHAPSGNGRQASSKDETTEQDDEGEIFVDLKEKVGGERSGGDNDFAKEKKKKDERVATLNIEISRSRLRRALRGPRIQIEAEVRKGKDDWRIVEATKVITKRP